MGIPRSESHFLCPYHGAPQAEILQMSTLYRSILQGISVGPAGGPIPPQDPLLRFNFALGFLTQSLQNLGFEAAPKERMMLTARLPLRNGDHPSQDSLRKLKKWRPPWRFLFS